MSAAEIIKKLKSLSTRENKDAGCVVGESRKMFPTLENAQTRT